jgi:hypothetical protein
MKTDMKTEIQRESEDRGWKVKPLTEDKIELSKPEVDPIILAVISTVPTDGGIIEITRPILNNLHEFAIDNKKPVILCIRTDEGIKIASTDKLISRSFDVGMESSMDSFEDAKVNPESKWDLPNLYRVKKHFKPLANLLSVDRGHLVGVLNVPQVSYQYFFDVKGSSRQIIRGGLMGAGL